MVKKFILFSLVCLFLTACSMPDFSAIKANQSQDAEKESKTEPEFVFDSFIPADITIASIGDSLTQGVGDDTDKGGYQFVLTEHLEKEKQIKDISMAHYGKRGLTSKGLIKQLQKNNVKNLVKQADVVIVTIGGNDVMSIVKQNYTHLQRPQFEKGMEQYEANLTEIISLIRDENPKGDIYLVGLYNPFTRWLNSIDEFDDIMVEWNNKTKAMTQTQKGVYFVEISPYFSSVEENLIYEEDSFHPNTKGYEKMGEAIYAEVKKNTLPRLQQQAVVEN
ncbi:MAG: GDSL-type esterase/lipase family protein [Bacillus sp. (in: firmicutes)]